MAEPNNILELIGIVILDAILVCFNGRPKIYGLSTTNSEGNLKSNERTLHVARKL